MKAKAETEKEEEEGDEEEDGGEDDNNNNQAKDSDCSMEEIIMLLTRMAACQSISKYAIQKDVRRSMDRSRSGSISSLSSSPRSPYTPGSPSMMNTLGFLSDQYSRFLFFEKHANEEISSLIRMASEEQIGLTEMITVLRIIEKAFGVKAQMCVKELVLQRVVQFIQPENKVFESGLSDMVMKDGKREKADTFELVFAFLYESCFELHASEGGLLRELLSTLTHTLCSFSQISNTSMVKEGEKKKEVKKDRLAAIAQGLLIILILLEINDPSLVTRLTAIIIHAHTRLSSPSSSSSTATATDSNGQEGMEEESDMTETGAIFDNLSLRHLADQLIHALKTSSSSSSSSSSLTSVLHACEILLESQVLPAALSLVLPSNSVKELSKYLQHGQSVIAYYHRYSFYDAITLSLTNTINSSSSTTTFNNASSDKGMNEVHGISTPIEERTNAVNMIDLPMSSSSESIRHDLCEAMMNALIRLERYPDAFFYIYNPLLVRVYSY